MEPWESVLVWGLFGLVFLFGGCMWIIQGRMLRRERARERETERLRRRIDMMEGEYGLR